MAATQVTVICRGRHAAVIESGGMVHTIDPGQFRDVWLQDHAPARMLPASDPPPPAPAPPPPAPPPQPDGGGGPGEESK